MTNITYISPIHETSYNNLDRLTGSRVTIQERLHDIAQRVLCNPLSWVTTSIAALVAVALHSVALPFTVILPRLGFGLVACGLLVYHCRKRLLFEGSLTWNIFQNALNPNKYVWWNKIDDNITLGAIPLKNKGHLNEIEADAVLTCLEDFEIHANSLFGVPVRPEEWIVKGKEVRQVKAEDFKPLTQTEIDESVEFIHQNISENKRVYVHCKAGRGRSATAVICYHIKYKNMSVEEALHYVKEKRPQISINKYQMQAIREFYARLM